MYSIDSVRLGMCLSNAIYATLSFLYTKMKVKGAKSTVIGLLQVTISVVTQNQPMAATCIISTVWGI